MLFTIPMDHFRLRIQSTHRMILNTLMLTLKTAHYIKIVFICGINFISQPTFVIDRSERPLKPLFCGSDYVVSRKCDKETVDASSFII